MKITKAQEQFLSTFVCERLSSSPQNKELIKSFSNSLNSSIANTLKLDGWDMDSSNDTAVFLVKNKKNIPLLLFSLQTGILFMPISDSLFEITRVIQSLKTMSEEKLNKFLDEIKVDGDLKEAFTQFIGKINKPNKKTYINSILLDEKCEGNRPIYKVHKSFSGIELVHFCKNDNIPNSVNTEWDSFFPTKTMGSVLFWKFVVPLVLDIRKNVGCKFLYLFAADPESDQDGKLTTYYKNLKFQILENIGTVKPAYDFKCIFMSQEVND